ncbi:SDR family NAD(P)-dependent oxidoreductase [Labrys monachus]|uniref:NAD(P)-dependent dehydrogenase (Short-subunit alcohol dehydrogenase family) n=1 Tax=Labrys monachus TaxID=217067 RepID=A0ABU0FE73_9HYPH|nr:glucose 1-dehydrogenase [Labrys monachus]MDQ0392907.1 NAD(P)-dependent dehydrogenase (short-subunit alcohol dehydrogenase family) [Labrys monachus]
MDMEELLPERESAPQEAAGAVSLSGIFGLDGLVAAVTGGGSGIGLAAAQALAAAGASVVILDRAEVADEILMAIKGAVPVTALVADVCDEAAVDAAFDKIAHRYGHVDILVNNAGLAIRDAAVNLSLEAWNKVVAVNMTGVFLCARSAARHMIASKRGGAIINTASIMALSGGGLYPNISYQTTKGALVNMTRALAVEWAPHAIRVNAIAPTYVRTPFIAPLLAQPELMRRIEDMTPLRRIAEPHEISPAIVFLAGPGASMITGHTLPIDGGFLAQ